ncbi:Uridine monophosphate kinase [Candidatus Similichlamydia laticola]|uniref:Uridylate kinase n=2 Tax=Candidatus Similichlamydia laticola TaxID=2170265 RepID=A0A369KCS7_9BACT|nr:Uridine monophosphate kinase [Candidatus Similichlamydia laticola]
MENGIDPTICKEVAQLIAQVVDSGYSVFVVLGGGNLWRGSQSVNGFPRYARDQIGMVATCMNCLALQQSFRLIGINAEVLSAIGSCLSFIPYSPQTALDFFNKKAVVLLAGGTGRAFCTTDTAAAFSACEIGAEVLLKATRVEGIYNQDPSLHTDARLLRHISFQEAIAKEYGVMDLTAFTLCMQENIPIKVFSLLEPKACIRALRDPDFGTYISNDKKGSHHGS